MLNWDLLLDVIIMLSAALVLGTLAEQIRLSAILGYLMAGMLIGPNVLGWVDQRENVAVIAELGVALLLFTIGLEFSFRQLRRLGRVALLGGSLQVFVTMLAGAGVAKLFGVRFETALAIGAMVALSSTACVLRLLVDRVVIESIYGRNTLGILLLQDLAVIPLMLLVLFLGEGGTLMHATLAFGRTVALAVGLVAGFFLLINFIVPRVLNLERWSRNREFPILFAIVLAFGSAYAAHRAHLSPAIGAFVAGVLLGGSPFATQIRADVGSLKTLLVTLFFASIGLLGNPAWVIENWHLVVGVVMLITVGKAVLIWAVVRLIGFTHGVAVATALCLAQVGEFSLVLAETARTVDDPLIGPGVFNMIVTASIATLFLTPFLVAGAPRAADLIESQLAKRRPKAAATGEIDGAPDAPHPHDIIIIGFGPAGQAVATALYEHHQDRIAVVELNPRTAASAQQLGLPVHLGDATQLEVLEHAGIAGAKVIAITVPDASAARAVIHRCRQIAPRAQIVARSRYHVRRWELEFAGAREIVDEEENTGLRIAAIVRKFLRPDEE